MKTALSSGKLRAHRNSKTGHFDVYAGERQDPPDNHLGTVQKLKDGWYNLPEGRMSKGPYKSAEEALGRFDRDRRRG